MIDGLTVSIIVWLNLVTVPGIFFPHFYQYQKSLVITIA